MSTAGEHVIASSVLALKMGETGRKIGNADDAETDDNGRLLGGRQMLRMIYKDFAKDFFKSKHDAMQDLMELKMVDTPEGLENFIILWENIVAMVKEPIANTFLCPRLHTQLNVIKAKTMYNMVEDLFA